MNPLYLLAYPIIRAIVKVVTGVTVATLVYNYINSVIMPIQNSIELKINSALSEFTSGSGSVFDVIRYLDFATCVNILLACSAACISVKLVAISIRAFGINTG